MRKRTIALGALAAALLAGGAWYGSLDKETRGILAALPTNADVLMWSQDQRDAAFRGMDRLSVLAEANTIAPSATPLPPGHPGRIPLAACGEGGDEGVLRDIEGLLGIARGGAGETIDRLAVALDQRALRPAVARQRPAHQRCIEIGAGHLSFWARLCAIAASKRAC